MVKISRDLLHYYSWLCSMEAGAGRVSDTAAVLDMDDDDDHTDHHLDTLQTSSGTTDNGVSLGLVTMGGGLMKGKG